ncbi:MAG: S-layer homology domain-containing protein, partial [Clostridia bacterium]|nr:S-layer homology domain-containing protein [Clostridia bacterium]
MKTRRLFSLITMLALLLSLTTTAFATYSYEETISPPADNVSQIIGDGNTVVFIDVPSNYWAKDQIDYFAQQGIIDGYTDGSFKPEAGVTREEFCKLLVSTFKQPLETPNTPTFADVPENRWSYPYVEVCREFLTGYANPFGGAPSFHPTEYATREDIAVALVRMMGFTDSDANNPNYAAYNFRDGGNISPNLLAYVSIACERGLISGYPDGTFGPTQGITRAETVVLLNRATK